MNAVYFYKSNSSYANILSDVIAMLTGETDVANLSSDCNKDKTTINTVIGNQTVLAGWEVWDDNVSSNYQILRSPYIGGGFKYIAVYVDSGGWITSKAYESWDKDTHTGTNESLYGFTSSFAEVKWRTGTVNNDVLQILSSERFYAFRAAPSSYHTVIMCEYSRDIPWNYIENGYPAICQVLINRAINLGSQPVALCRAMNKSGIDVTFTSAWANLYAPGTKPDHFKNEYTFPQGDIIFGSGNKRVIPLIPLIIGEPDVYGVQLGNISIPCDIWITVIDVVTNYIKVRYDNGDGTYTYLTALYVGTVSSLNFYVLFKC